MGLQLKPNILPIKKTILKTTARTRCPICKCLVEELLYKHIEDLHDSSTLNNCIIKDFDKGLTHPEIGKKYGVTLRYIEKIITDKKGVNISNFRPISIKVLQPKDFKEENSTVWSFKNRGSWATHSGEYRGNWSPYIPRNIILKYSSEGDLILDNFCGAGTTAIEARLLNRQCFALDINKHAVERARENLYRLSDATGLFIKHHYMPEFIVGDARDLMRFKDNTFDLICSHPPYANIIKYTANEKDDLSHLNRDNFLSEMKKVAEESYRVLKPGKKCAVLIGDMRKNKYVVPLGFDVIDVYLSSGFRLHELIIKRQHNCKTTGFWYANSVKYNFLLLAHEYLPIFEKPIDDEEESLFKSYNPTISTILDFEKEIKLPEDNRLETTTVWIAKDPEFEKHILSNLICRYGRRNNSFSYETLGMENKLKTREIPKKLLFIPCTNLSNRIDVVAFLKNIKNLFARNLPFVYKDGYIVIYVQDIDAGYKVIPLAKLVINEISHNELKLKEIIVAIRENDEKSDRLQKIRRVHGYLLVYEKK